ncbi:hypothetical protein C8Q77DRAFT_1158877 [Trametes polyzona]|nr:hypothetical protein C8Q77DRAFT_1158877 [Trametes polyzona]
MDDSREDRGNGLERPRKRQRLSPETGSHSPTIQQIILEEIDLEVDIRKRIADTVQSRITWALLLQESLRKSIGSRSDDFRSASLDALDAIEAPCDLIFDREVRLPPQPLRPLVNTGPSLPSTEPASLPSAYSRSTRTRGPPRAAPAPRERLLYIRNTATDPPEVAKLACHVCSRSDFSNLQGLLNHCRLRHQIEYGSHDECMQSCAVLVPDNERDWVVACGIEVGGVSLPSLKRLFELAVGAGDRVVLPTRKPSPAMSTPAQGETVKEEAVPSTETKAASEQPQPPKEAPESSAHLTKTLGYHADTPALAPFLGRAPKKRCINVRANEDERVDIEDMSGGSGLHRQRVWRKPYAHRNIARKELDEIVPLGDIPSNTSDAQPEPAREISGQSDGTEVKDKSVLQTLSGTRFHINARVKVADYSLFIPPNRRPAEHPEHTHAWRLAVTSPSYSLSITSILRKLTVACVTDPAPATMSEPIVISESPFVVTSTTDRPFLARLTFTWAGAMNPPTEIEHWVELDPMHYANPVLGDDQVFDVELDRNTELLPARDDVTEPTLEDMVNVAFASERAAEAVKSEEVEVEPGYAVKLRSLLPQFPMTMKDVKGRFSSRLPYTLVAAPAQLRNMPYGRRKAIEMGRARALRDAYTQLIEQSGDADAIPLTVVDVYHWLEDEGFFLRPADGLSEAQKLDAKSSRRQRAPAEGAADAYCRTCGLHRAYHPNVPSEEDTKPVVDIKPAALGAALERGLCMSFAGEEAPPTRRPIFDVDALLAFTPTGAAEEEVPYGLGRAIFTAPPPSSGRTMALAAPPANEDLVAVADPKLVVAIQRLTGLPYPHKTAFVERSDANGGGAPAPVTTLPRAEAATRLAPAALLAAVLQPFVRQLVGRGVDALRQDEAALRVATGRHHERARRATAVTAGGSSSSSSPRRVLAPSHVLRGVARMPVGAAGGAGGALRVCLGRLGQQRSALALLGSGQGGDRGGPDPTDGTLHIGRGAGCTGRERDGRGEGDTAGEKDRAIIPGPGSVLPGDVVVKEEEEGET